MIYCQDTTGKLYQFTDTTINPLAFCPQGSVVLDPTAAASLLNLPTPLKIAQDAKINGSMSTQSVSLMSQFASAGASPVSFTTAAGVTKTFQCDDVSIKNIANTLAGNPSGVLPVGFPGWISADNTVVAFTYADLQGLANAIWVQGNAAFQRLQVAKAAVKAATTVSAVNAVTF